MMKRADEAGVKTLILPAIDASTHQKMVEIADAFPACIPMIGLHPCSVKGDYTSELDQVSHWLEKRKFIAIGEIGLDFYWDKTFISQQYEAFHSQIVLALAR